MTRLTRRDFLIRSSTAALALSGSATLAQSDGGDSSDTSRTFDLLIKGGRVVDPTQQLDAPRDIAVRSGLIMAIEPDIPADRADNVLDVSGKLVTAGLVDFHTHVFPYGSALGIPPDELAPLTCTTTAVSAGDAGANNLAALRRFVAGEARTRVYSFVHIANFGLAGFPVGEMLNIDHAEVENCARAVAANRDFCLGVKVRESIDVVGDNGLEPLRRAIRAAELAGPWAKVMCHIGNSPGDLSELMEMLREGDTITHTYSGAGNNIVQDGKLLDSVLDARDRGVRFGVGHGGGSFDFTVAEPAIEQGLVPDFISSDIHVYSGNSPGQPYLPNVMSKFLALGLSLEDVIRKATQAPGAAIGREKSLGTLSVGGAADIAVMDLISEDTTFVDTRENERQGNQVFKAVATIRAGVPFGQPYGFPFSRR